jgi:hypothetical protein
MMVEETLPVAAPAPAMLLPGRLVAWLAAGLALAIALAWLSIRLQVAGFAPVGLFSILLGAALGGGLVLLLRWLAIGHRKSILAGTIVLAIATSLGQFWFAYRDHVAQSAATLRNNPKAALFRGEDEAGFFPSFAKWLSAKAAHRANVAWWTADAVAVAVAATGLVWLAVGTPYCNRCRGWYRMTRSGHIPRATAGGLAAGIDLLRPDSAEAVQYRLATCPAACGPARIELSWKVAGRDARAVRWLDPTARTALEAELARAAAATS